MAVYTYTIYNNSSPSPISIVFIPSPDRNGIPSPITINSGSSATIMFNSPDVGGPATVTLTAPVVSGCRFMGWGTTSHGNYALVEGSYSVIITNNGSKSYYFAYGYDVICSVEGDASYTNITIAGYVANNVSNITIIVKHNVNLYIQAADSTNETPKHYFVHQIVDSVKYFRRNGVYYYNNLNKSITSTIYYGHRIVAYFKKITPDVLPESLSVFNVLNYEFTPTPDDYNQSSPASGIILRYISGQTINFTIPIIGATYAGGRYKYVLTRITNEETSVITTSTSTSISIDSDSNQKVDFIVQRPRKCFTMVNNDGEFGLIYAHENYKTTEIKFCKMSASNIKSDSEIKDIATHPITIATITDLSSRYIDAINKNNSIYIYWVENKQYVQVAISHDFGNTWTISDTTIEPIDTMFSEISVLLNSDNSTIMLLDGALASFAPISGYYSNLALSFYTSIDGITFVLNNTNYIDETPYSYYRFKLFYWKNYLELALLGEPPIKAYRPYGRPEGFPYNCYNNGILPYYYIFSNYIYHCSDTSTSYLTRTNTVTGEFSLYSMKNIYSDGASFYGVYPPPDSFKRGVIASYISFDRNQSHLFIYNNTIYCFVYIENNTKTYEDLYCFQSNDNGATWTSTLIDDFV